MPSLDRRNFLRFSFLGAIYLSVNGIELPKLSYETKYIDNAYIYGTPESRRKILEAAKSSIEQLRLYGFPNKIVVLDPSSTEFTKGVDENVYGNIHGLISPKGSMSMRRDGRPDIQLSSKNIPKAATDTTKHELGHAIDPWYNVKLRSSELWEARQRMVQKEIPDDLKSYEFFTDAGENGIFYQMSYSLGKELWQNFLKSVGISTPYKLVSEDELKESGALYEKNIFGYVIRKHIKQPFDVIQGFSEVELGAALMSLWFEYQDSLEWGGYKTLVSEKAYNTAWCVSSERWAENLAQGGGIYPYIDDLQYRALELARKEYNCR